MKLSHLSETLIGSEIVKLGGEIREKIRQGEKIYNFTVGDFDPSIFPYQKNWKMKLSLLTGIISPIIPLQKEILIFVKPLFLLLKNLKNWIIN